MSQLRYHQRAYFRSSQTDAESFKPYAFSIVAIVLVTFLSYGLQNTVISSSAIASGRVATFKLHCSDFAEALKMTNCSDEKITKAGELADSSYTLEQDLQSFTN